MLLASKAMHFQTSNILSTHKIDRTNRDVNPVGDKDELSIPVSNSQMLASVQGEWIREHAKDLKDLVGAWRETLLGQQVDSSLMSPLLKKGHGLQGFDSPNGSRGQSLKHWKHQACSG
jgi:hypothetical protein